MNGYPDTDTYDLSRRWRLLAVCLIAFGVVVRFVNLGGLVYWDDEAIHAAYSYGTFRSAVQEQVRQWDGAPVPAEALLAFQRPAPDRGPGDVVRALYTEEPQSPPVHYLMLHGWTRLFGDSIPARRALSALQSLLFLVGVFWLFRELFRDPGPAWIATSFAAVSPIMLLMAREVRYYVLWAGLMACLTAMLLRATRLDGWRHWAAYAALLTLGMWVFPLTGMVAVGHGVWLLLTRRPLLGTLVRFATAGAVAALLYLPWLRAYGGGDYQFGGWRDRGFELWVKVPLWMHTLALGFADGGIAPVQVAVFVPVVVIVSLGCVFVCVRRAPLPVWLLGAVMGGSIWLPFLVRDLTRGGMWSHIPRYVLPAYLGLFIAVTWTVARGLRPEAGTRARRAAAATWVILAGLGVVSCVRAVSAETWWHRYEAMGTPRIAAAINAASAPVLVARLDRGRGWSLFSVAYELEDHARLALTDEWSDPPPVMETAEEFFLYDPPETVLEALRARGRETVQEAALLYRVTGPSPSTSDEPADEDGSEASTGGTASTALRLR